MSETGRPSPEQMLQLARQEAERTSQQRRGRLKVFFGAAPGVGKTYAMLNAANRLAREGVDVVVGLVETHGRTETEQLLLGLDLLPRRTVEYRGVTMHEFDLDAALRRRPEIVLVDELAHTNAPGSRFEKRWQDVQELLRAGISVYTTLNVQHIESLNDVIGQITGVQVRETVPDAVVEQADEIELVDLPPEALLERLHSGKVYVPDTVRQAIDSFFRVNNLTALRELALRRTAEWVDARAQQFAGAGGAGNGGRAGGFSTNERILVAVSPSPLSPRLVRAAKRLAAGMRGHLIAAYVETPKTARLPQADRERVVQTLRLAESLSAEVVTLSGQDAAAELVTFARSRNVTKIVIGKTGQTRWRERLFGSFANEVMRRSGDIDVYVIRGEVENVERRLSTAELLVIRRHSSWREYAWAMAIVVACTVFGLATLQRLELTNLVMLYLLGVVIAATRLGRGPAALTAVMGVAAFDFFFVPPRFTFAVSDVEYLLTFGVMLAVGLLIAGLTNRLRELATIAQQREGRTAALYAMSRELAAARDRADVGSIAVRHVHDTFDADVALLVPQATNARVLEVAATAGSPDWLDDRERGVSQWALDHAKVAGLGTRSLPSVAARHIPLVTPGGTQGVLAIHPRRPGELITPQQTLLLETFANQVALALERVVLLEGQQAARIDAEAERLRSALLSSVSHDLRTPLATITGATSTLLEGGAALDETTRRNLLQSVDHEAQRLNELIANLMFATRLESGTIEPRSDWTTVEEIIGSGLAYLQDALSKRPFTLLVPHDLPLLRVDSALMPQVIHNLVDNALRHTPQGTPIEITAWATDQNIMIRIMDEGPGFPPGDEQRVFERFYRGPRTRRAGDGNVGGMGLGLTIAQGIVRAHGGRIWAENNHTPAGAPAPGASMFIALPLERPQPSIPAETTNTKEEAISLASGGVRDG